MEICARKRRNQFSNDRARDRGVPGPAGHRLVGQGLDRVSRSATRFSRHGFPPLPQGARARRSQDALKGRALHVAGRATRDRVTQTVAHRREIANLAVVPTARRRGVARALLEAIVAEARESRIVRLFLEVRESNAAARTLYASAGFAPIARRARYYRKPVEDAIVLRLEL